MESPPPAIRLDHAVIHISDWERSNAFYRDVLGATLVPNPEAATNPMGGWAYRFGRQQLNVHGPWPGQAAPCCPPPLNEPGRVHLCFGWPDSIETAIEHLKRLRVRVVNGPATRYGAGGTGTSIDFIDPDGNLIELISYRVREPGRTEPGRPDNLRAAWDDQAEAWTRWARAPGHDSYWRFGRAAFFELLPEPGRLTIDLGCGEGRVSRDLAARGHKVVSIDTSKRLLHEATAAAPDIPAVVGDAAAIPLASGCCDLVVAYMSLQDVDDMEEAVLEAARVLQPSGHLCLAVVHPISSAGQFEGTDRDAVFVIESAYLEAHPYADRIDRDGLSMTFASRHHPLAGYFGALEAAGFLVEALREVPVDEASAAAEPRRARWRRMPLFLDIRAIKTRP